MARDRVHGAPYQAVRALSAWALGRRGYLRGRLLLAGVNPASLDFAEWIDVAEAAIVEGPMHGAWVGLDEVLKKLEQGIAEADPDPETWGTTTAAAESQAAAEALFPQAAPRPKRPRPERSPDDDGDPSTLPG